MRSESLALLVLGGIGVGLGFGQSSPATLPAPVPKVEAQTVPFEDGRPDSSDGADVIAEAAPSPIERWYANAEYILWWLREGRVPPILTAGAPAFQGIPGAGDTRVVYGDGRLETRHGDRFNGTRITMGLWLTSEPVLALEAKAFFLERDSTAFKMTSAGDTLLAMPYINAANGAPASIIVAGPSPKGTLAGGFVGYSRLELFGQECNLAGLLADGANGKVEILAGVRFLEMRDRFDPTAVSRVLPDEAVLLGLSEHFRSHDFFYGGQVGLRGTLVRGRWSLSLRGQAAFGADLQEVRTFAESTFQTPTMRSVQNTGLFVQSSNLGSFHRDVFDMVYETGFNLTFQVTRRIDLFGGYTFLYWANPIRAADQVDTTINATPGGPGRPQVTWREDRFWAQGVNVGMQFRW